LYTLALAVPETRWHAYDCVLDVFAEERTRVGFDLREHHATQLLCLVSLHRTPVIHHDHWRVTGPSLDYVRPAL
jgi:hypothetical protein